MLGFAVLFMIVPGPLARLYTQDPAVIAMVEILLPIAAAFQVFDGLQVVSAGVLRGAADTTFPAAVAFVGYWAIGLPTGWWLAFRAGLGPRGLWWGFTVGLAAVAGLLLLRIAVRLRRPLARAGAAAGAR
jgi:MATE family multidrug resistance protein